MSRFVRTRFRALAPAFVLLALAGVGAVARPAAVRPRPASTAVDPPRLWGPLRSGSHDVGFEILGLRDSGRSLSEGVPRPIQLALWYPAVASEGSGARPVTYRDYVVPIAAERSLETPDDSLARETIRAFGKLLASNGVDAAAMEAWLSSPMAAVRGAEPATERLPLVLIAPGTFHSPYHHAILAEYLASHGFVVAVAPAPSRLTGPPGEGQVLEYARTQAEDLAFIRRALVSDPRVDADRAAIVAHSFGARSGFLALLDGTWRGLVSLDGGIGNARGREWLDGVAFDPTAVRTPILHLYEDVDPEIVEPDFELLRSLSGAETTLIRVEELHHVHFTSLGLISGVVPGIRVGPASPEVVEKAAGVHEATRAFLEARLRGGSAGALAAVVGESPHLELRRP